MRSQIFLKLSTVIIVATMLVLVSVNRIGSGVLAQGQATAAAPAAVAAGACPATLATTLIVQMSATPAATLAATAAVRPATAAATPAATAAVRPATAAATPAATAAAAATGPVCYVAMLRGGAEEVPNPGDPDGFGVAAITIDAAKREVTFNVAVSRITLPAAGMHIHVGAARVAGPIVVDPKVAPAVNGAVVVTVPAVDAALIAQIVANPAGYYVNVHTSDFPGGAVRGQLAKYEVK